MQQLEQRLNRAMAPRRKKWTEEEERALLDKYAEMAADGSLSRLRTRERRFRPIAAHVNASHHAANPVAYPFLWSWKDAATKVHNMRHQYLLVKRKLLQLDPAPSSSPPASPSSSAAADWAEQQGVSHWPNFLRYRAVFGDAPLPPADHDPASCGPFDHDGELGLGLGFECCGEDGGEGADREVDDEEGFDFEDVPPAAEPSSQLPAPPLSVEFRRTKGRKKRRSELRRALAVWREREARMEEKEAEWEMVRREREWAAAEAEEERERRRRQSQQRWREKELEWEERIEGRRVEWRKRMDGMLTEHRTEMEQIQARILHEQQSVVGQLVGMLSQWAPSPVFGGLSDGGGGGTPLGNHHQSQHQPAPYLSQTMQGLHHVNGIVPGENRVDGDGPEDHFIVDD